MHMTTRYIVRRPARATGNAGMPTPYEQGRDAALRGEAFRQVYDQPGEHVEARDFAAGYAAGRRVLG